MSDQLALAFTDPPLRQRAASLRSFHAHGAAPTVAEALAGELRAATQEQRLLAYFRAHPQARLTRYDAAAILGCKDSSGGRALSNLRDRGFLRKRLDLRVEGPCGASCHPYELVEEPAG